MCSAHGLSRRSLLAGTIGAAGALVLGSGRAGAASAAFPPHGFATVDVDGVDVIPRSSWGGDLPPTGPIPAEPDVRYLLVHHSVDPGNGYGEATVAGVLRGFVRFHTSQKGWPDLAYNFLVDRFGRVWEGRTGSLAGPVAGDATGGNQGFDQLCCFIGNHQVGEPSPQAFQAMGRLLGVLARRYGVPLGPTATAVFTSKGSNRHPAGTEVTTSTIAGHRDMSRTQCPGDLVVARMPELRVAAASMAPNSPASGGPPPAAPRLTAPPGSSLPAPAPAASPRSAPGSASLPGPATTSVGRATSDRSAGTGHAAGTSSGRSSGQSEGRDGVVVVGAVAAGAAGAAAAGAVWERRRRAGALDRPGRSESEPAPAPLDQ